MLAAPALHRPLMAFSSCRHIYPLPAKPAFDSAGEQCNRRCAP
jgi:hypothetical protein